MEESLRVCRRCLLLESGEADVLADIQKRMQRIPEKEKTPQEIYQARLTACRQCDFLLGGICMKCGCYPEFRAAFRKNRCPNPTGDAWAR